MRAVVVKAGIWKVVVVAVKVGKSFIEKWSWELVVMRKTLHRPRVSHVRSVTAGSKKKQRLSLGLREKIQQKEQSHLSSG